MLGNPLSDFAGLPILLRALERRGFAAEIVPGMPRATLSASITMPLVPLPPGSLHQNWDDLVEIMARLRRSCPWDREQTHASLVRYLIEETFEVVEAIESQDEEDICEELGDLLFQVVFHSQLGTERGKFSVADVIDNLSNKMSRAPSARLRRRRGRERRRSLGRIGSSSNRSKKAGWSAAPGSTAFPRHSVRSRAARRCRKRRLGSASIGPPRARSPRSWRKNCAELAEAREAAGGERPDDAHVREELGDVLFTVVNLARRLSIDAEGAMRDANRKFERRFRYMESSALAAGVALNDMSIDELETLWQQAKTAA